MPPPRIGKGGRLIGTIREPNYSEQRRISEAQRISKRAKKRRRVLERFSGKRSWRWSSKEKIRALQAAVDVLKAQTKKINPPRRKKPPIPQKQRPLLYRLVRAQHIGKQWIPILNKMISSGMIYLHKNMYLRQEIAAAIRPFNKGAAEAFAQGRELYFQTGNQPLENILKTARQKPSPEMADKKALELKNARRRNDYW